MNITFLGTGEACDPKRRNTSILIEHNELQVLLDCGFNSFQAYLERENTGSLNILWLSHFHGDHFFGFPQLILHYFVQGRTQPLTILSGTDSKDKLIAALELAYPGLYDKLGFPLNFMKTGSNTPIDHLGFYWQSVPVIHSQDAFAVKITFGTFSLFYSGDGKITAESKQLMTGCDLVVHEAYSQYPNPLSHSSIEECVQTADELTLAAMALVHISKETWALLDAGKIPSILPETTRIILPQDGDTLSFP